MFISKRQLDIQNDYHTCLLITNQHNLIFYANMNEKKSQIKESTNVGIGNCVCVINLAKTTSQQSFFPMPPLEPTDKACMI